MPLHIEVAGIKDHESFCYKRDENGKIVQISDKSKDIGFTAMATGIGQLRNEEDCYEFYVRMQAFDAIGRIFGGKSEITLDDLFQHIGLRTNVSNETRAQWTKRIFEHAIRELKYQRRRKAEEEQRKRDEELAAVPPEVEAAKPIDWGADR